MRLNRTRFLLKLLISVGLMAYLVRHIDLFSFASAFLDINFGYVLLGLLVYPLGQLICVIKWRRLALALGIQKGLKPLAELYFMGNFLNVFLPTGVGGDITRSLYLSPGEGKRHISFLSVLAERGTGVLSMCLLASLVMLSPYGEPIPFLLRFGFPLATFGLLASMAILPLLIRRTRTRMRRILQEDLIVFWKDPLIGLIAMVYSGLFHTALVGIHICIARSLGLEIPIPYHFVTLAIASLISLVPSFNGIGVRDAAYVYLLMLVGVDKAHALLFSFLWFFTMTISSGIGFVVYLLHGLAPLREPRMADQR